MFNRFGGALILPDLVRYPFCFDGVTLGDGVVVQDLFCGGNGIEDCDGDVS